MLTSFKKILTVVAIAAVALSSVFAFPQSAYAAKYYQYKIGQSDGTYYLDTYEYDSTTGQTLKTDYQEVERQSPTSNNYKTSDWFGGNQYVYSTDNNGNLVRKMTYSSDFNWSSFTTDSALKIEQYNYDQNGYMTLQTTGGNSTTAGPIFGQGSGNIITTDAVTGQQTVTTVPSAQDSGPNFGCSKSFSLDNILRCLAGLLYYAIMTPASWLLGLSSILFDRILDMTFRNLAALLPSTAIEVGWKAIRDVLNIGFIFALLFMSFRYILNMKGKDENRVLTRLIIAAFLINFSLFFAKFFIDIGNRATLEVYNGLTTQGTQSIASIQGYWDVPEVREGGIMEGLVRDSL